MKTGILRPLTAARWTSGQRAVNIDNMNTRILLVEDDERLAELTAEYLTKNDLKVSIEPRGDTAEARILAEQPDLVILDVMLPGKDGFEVCRAVRPHYRGVILMLTARDEDFDQILGLEMGADDYIAKPVQPRVLLARIKALRRRLPTAADGQGSEAEAMVFGQFKISQSTRTASLNGTSIYSGSSPHMPATCCRATICCKSCAALALTGWIVRLMPVFPGCAKN